MVSMAQLSLLGMRTEDQQYKSLSTLNDILQLDGFYKGAAESLISEVYQTRTNNPIFSRFNYKFMGLPCSGHTHRHLIFIWCGLLGLKYLRDGNHPRKPELDVLDNWMGDVEIGMNDLLFFLRKNLLPLPVALFETEPDNTRNRVNLRPKVYTRLCKLQLEVLPHLQRSLEDLVNLPPRTASERKAKQEDIGKLEEQIQIIQRGEDPAKRPAPKEPRNKARNDAIWEKALEYRSHANPKSGRWIALKISKSKIAEGLSYDGVRSVLYQRKKIEDEKMDEK